MAGAQQLAEIAQRDVAGRHRQGRDAEPLIALKTLLGHDTVYPTRGFKPVSKRSVRLRGGDVMGAKEGGRQSARDRWIEGLSDISTFSGDTRISRASLLAGASLAALAALAAPDQALAHCSGMDLTFSTPTSDPILSAEPSQDSLRPIAVGRARPIRGDG
jgi:hypothetical protein